MVSAAKQRRKERQREARKAAKERPKTRSMTAARLKSDDPPPPDNPSLTSLSTIVEDVDPGETMVAKDPPSQHNPTPPPLTSHAKAPDDEKPSAAPLMGESGNKYHLLGDEEDFPPLPAPTPATVPLTATKSFISSPTLTNMFEDIEKTIVESGFKYNSDKKTKDEPTKPSPSEHAKFYNHDKPHDDDDHNENDVSSIMQKQLFDLEKKLNFVIKAVTPGTFGPIPQSGSVHHLSHSHENFPDKSSFQQKPVNSVIIDDQQHVEDSNQEQHSPYQIPRPSPTSLGSTLFGQNEFSLAMTHKVKLINLGTSIKNVSLEGDHVLDMESFYSGIIRSINSSFETTLTFLPDFMSLTPNINFEKLFLDKLSGMTLKKANNLFQQIGQYIKSHLLSNESGISKTTTPMAKRVIDTTKHAKGWKMLETLLKKRVVLCGASPEKDLDTQRISIKFEENQQFHDFYTNMVNIKDTYMYQYGDINMVPTTKLLQQFVLNLNRAPEYIPYILPYHTILHNHIRKYGDVNSSHLIPFTMEQIYEKLIDHKVPDTPSMLHPLPALLSIDPSQTEQLPSSTDNTTNDDLFDLRPPVVAASSTTVDDTTDLPIICAISRLPIATCPACLLGKHKPEDCWMRGPKFRPSALNQRLNVYNATYGDSPPKDHTKKEYKPRGLQSSLVNQEKHPSSNSKLKLKRPFNNAVSKVKTTSSINSINGTDYSEFEPMPESAITIDPSINSFIQKQQELLAAYQSGNAEDIVSAEASMNTLSVHFSDDVINPSTCAFIAVINSVNDTRPQQNLILNEFPSAPFNIRQPHSASWTSAIRLDQYTPQEIVDVVLQIHQDNPAPRRSYLHQHSLSITNGDIPEDHLSTYCDIYFHVDSGANVGATPHRHLFYFYVPSPTPVENATGTSTTSPGWGGILVSMDDDHGGKRPYLLAPYFHCPTHPRNTLSLIALRCFTGFQRVLLEPGITLHLVNQHNEEINLPIEVRNSLDFVKLQVLYFGGVPINTAANEDSNPPDDHDMPPPNVPPPLNILETSTVGINLSFLPFPVEVTSHIKSFLCPSSSTTSPLPFNKDVMIKIFAYYLDLHSSIAPKSIAVSTINQLINNQYQSQSILHRIDQATSPPLINSLFTATTSSLSPLQTYMFLHLSLLHASKSTIAKMLARNLFRDAPSLPGLRTISCSCTICQLTKSTLTAKGSLVDHTNLRPFQRLHVDFSFYNVESIRGFTSAFDITDASTSYQFGFPTKAKTPPIAIFKYFIGVIRSMGNEPNFVRLDEDSSLARSSEFCQMIMDNNLVLETTAGGNSTNNGKVERGNRTTADMIRAMLATFQLIVSKNCPQTFDVRRLWCFAYQYSKFVQRRLINHSTNKVPFTVVHGIKPSLKEIPIFGSYLTAVTHNKNSMPKIDSGRAKEGYFLGFSNNIRHFIYWTPTKPMKYYRTPHAKIDEVRTFSLVQPIFASPTELPFGRQLNMIPSYQPAVPVTPLTCLPDLQAIQHPFGTEQMKTFRLHLPVKGRPIGLVIEDDVIFNIPVITKSIHGSPAHTSLPPKSRHNMMILGIEGDSPITAAYAIETLRKHQSTSPVTINIDLVSRGPADRSTSLAISRAIFDQLPSLIPNRPVISSMISTDIPDSHMHLVTSPTKPPIPDNWGECLKSPLRKHWIAAAKVQFTKNHNLAVYSLPLHRSLLPQDSTLLRAILVPEIKKTEVPTIWELRARLCVVGTPQEEGVDFYSSYCATVELSTVRFICAIAAALQYHVAVIDISNCFQRTLWKTLRRQFIRLPPYYLEWLQEFIKYKTNESQSDLVLEMFNATQGNKSASREWKLLYESVLSTYGMTRCTVDHGLFIKAQRDGTYLYVGVATDDNLCAFPSYQHFDDFVKFLEQYFVLSVQTGRVLEFLNMRIVQSSNGISLDQGTYVYNLVHEYFKAPDLERIKTVTTPLRYDSKFNQELYESSPLSDSELLDASLKYRGSYRHHIGSILFAAIATRFDLAFAIQRLSEYNSAPTEVSFQAVSRIYRYLAGDVLRPLMYPATPLDGTSTINYITSGNDKSTFSIPNEMCVWTDAEFATDMATRASYYCVVITINGVAIDCKVKKTIKIMTNTTDSELNASYVGVKRILPFRSLALQMGLNLRKPTPLFGDNGASIAVIQTERMTPRCRHLDIPIAFLHQERRDGTFREQQSPTQFMLADIGTKQPTPVIYKRLKDWICGRRYYPNEKHDHYLLLSLKFFEQSYIYIRDNTKLPSTSS